MLEGSIQRLRRVPLVQLVFMFSGAAEVSESKSCDRELWRVGFMLRLDCRTGSARVARSVFGRGHPRLDARFLPHRACSG